MLAHLLVLTPSTLRLKRLKDEREMAQWHTEVKMGEKSSLVECLVMRLCTQGLAWVTCGYLQADLYLYPGLPIPMTHRF